MPLPFLGKPDAPLRRTRFNDLWQHLPSIVLLSALPGWGRTTWIEQFAEQHSNSERLPIISSRRALLDEFAAPTPRPLLVDEVFKSSDDPLWPQLIEYAKNSEHPTIVSLIDTPDSSLPWPTDTLVLHERDLALNQAEMAELAENWFSVVSPELLSTLEATSRGCPELVVKQLSFVANRVAEKSTTPPNPGLHRQYADQLALLLTQVGNDSQMRNILQKAIGLRRFSARLLHSALPGITPMVIAAHFDRLTSFPLGRTDIDEAGRAVFEWSAPVWEHLIEISGKPKEEVLRDALEASHQFGSPLTKLYYLLQLDDFAGADQLAFNELRTLMLFLPKISQEALLDVPIDRITDFPNLALIAAEARQWALGPNPRSRQEFEIAHRGLIKHLRSSPTARLPWWCRLSLAAVGHGDRRSALRYLGLIHESLLTPGDEIKSQELLAERLSHDLYFPYWAATQLDQHDLALELAELMVRYPSPVPMMRHFNELTLRTQQDFAGIRSLDTSAHPTGEEPSHSSALLWLEEGEDDKAYADIESTSKARTKAPTRSAADALRLLVKSLAAPERLAINHIDETVDASSSHWQDNKPSSFIAFAAACGLLILGRPQSARELVRRCSTNDWYTLSASALIALEQGRGKDALQLAMRAVDTTELPRQRVLAEVLVTRAYLINDKATAARDLLGMSFRRQPSPRLFRFALRFTTLEELAQLSDCSRYLPELRDTLLQSKADKHPFENIGGPALTSAEHEILSLLAAGYSNPQIANARVVSHNTVRSQLKRLFRKLGVSSRDEAVQEGRKRSLID